MRLRPTLVLASLLLAFAACAQDGRLPVNNGDFEQGQTGWTFEDQGMSSLSQEQAASGRTSLKTVDTSDKAGSNARCQPVAVGGGKAYSVRARSFSVSGDGLGIYVRLLDAQRQLIGKGDEFQRAAPTSPRGQWTDFELSLFTSPDTRFLEIWIHSYGAAIVTGYLDDFQVIDLGALPVPDPLWTPQYKLRPTDTARLTKADVVGPDGLVYPDFSRAGVPGGIPTVPTKAKLRDFGGLPDDNRDDGPALVAAAQQLGAAGGGAVLLEAGTYHLDTLVNIPWDRVVIRGAGRDQTKLLFRYAMGPSGCRWAEPAGDELYPDSPVTFQAIPKNLKRLQVFANGQQVADRVASTHWGNTFQAGVSTSSIFKAVPADATMVTLRGVATYADGSTKQLERALTLRRQGNDPAGARRGAADVAIGFSGSGDWWRAKQLKLAADGKRGDTTLTLASTEGLKAGDWVILDGPATERWKTLTRNKCPHGSYRRNILQLRAVTGNTVELDQPLRIEFPVVDGSQLWRIDPVVGCGLEDLTIEQTEDLWITTVQFRYAVGCWARGVTVKKCGRMPIYGYNAKFCTIADCVFDDAWYKGGGGTAYGGWEVSYDCLLTDCTTYKLRHAPCVQWSASGCVLRNSTFHESDMQWHSGWTNENLYELCTVIAKTGHGAYGYGAWASPPEDEAHGPNGPRNVVYNCDLSSPRAGLWMGGMNEAWMLLYNRFVAESGTGIFAKTFSFDHVIRGNVFALKQATQPAVVLNSPDCTGVEVYENTLYGGNGAIYGGAAKLAVERDNRVLPYQADPPRPRPAVPSIYQWQVANVKR